MSEESATTEDEAWELTRQLVQIDSSDPGAYEGEIERFIKAWVEERVAKLPAELASRIRIDELEALPGRTELMVSVPARDGSASHEGDADGGTAASDATSATLPRLVYICHMDTVTLGDGWDADISPLSGLVRDDRLYGRGSCDMKSGLASALVALERTLARIAETGELPRRAFSLICTVDEEDFMRGVEAALREGWVGATDWVLDTEPTDAQIQVAHKGRTWFELTMEGVTAHASQPWKGADAIAAMAEAICRIRAGIEAQPEHAELGRSTVTFGQIEGGYRPYVVPDRAKVWIDMRLVPPCDTSRATSIVEQAIVEAEAAVPGTHGSYEITGDRPAIERDPASPLLAALLDASSHVLGEPAEVGIFTGYTDTAVIAGKTGNRNCMSYGPGSLAQAHKPNEFVSHADVRRAQAVLSELASELLW